MRLSLVSSLFAAALAVVLGACGEQRSARSPSLDINPDRFTFARLTVGESAEDEVTVSNTGQGDLIIRSIALRDDSTAREFTLRARAADGVLSEAPDAVTLAPNERLFLVVSYTPTDESVTADRGAVVLETNDATQLTAEIPIGGGDQGAEIVVSPLDIDFGAVEAGRTAERPVEISNIGVGTLIISGLTINGSSDFTLLENGEPLPDLSSAPMEIGPSESRSLTVVYAPMLPGPDGAELIVYSNDPRQPETVVELAANGAAACIRVIPEDVDFGASLVVADIAPETPTPNRESLIVESCGGSALEVESIEITGADAAFFRVAEVFESNPDAASPLFVLPAAVDGQPAPARTIALEFRPTEERVYGARLLIKSNTIPDVTEVVLFGRGVENQCPVPRSSTESYDVAPLDIITLDGSPSNDPGGEVVEWRWSIVTRPDGSVAKLVESYSDDTHPADGGPDDDPATPEARFFVDVAGQYEFELIVVDELGQESCEPLATARVTVSAVPDKDLHIQLVWTTPDDPDETDMRGTDVDLHLRHPMANGGWNTDAGAYDCYFANKTPDWGAQLDPADNPSLDIDDTNGAGPENINLARPEPVTYDVAALYFRAESALGGDDPTVEHLSLVTVRIYARGELLAEWLDKEMQRRADLWFIASVRWCEDLTVCPEIVTVDELLSEAEYDLP